MDRRLLELLPYLGLSASVQNGEFRPKEPSGGSSWTCLLCLFSYEPKVAA